MRDTTPSHTTPAPGRVVHVRAGREAIYIGRPGRGVAGPWGNPYPLRRGASARERLECIERYRAHLWGRVQSEGAPLIEQLAQIAGRSLACFCAPAPCHGDVLAQAAVWAFEIRAGRGERTVRPAWAHRGGRDPRA